MSKIIQSGRFFVNMISNLAKRITGRPCFPLAKDVFQKLETIATSSILDKAERKISGQGAVKAGKGFNLFISKENMDDIIKIITSLENSGLIVDDGTETVKHEIKK